MPRWRRNPTGTVDSAPLWLSIATCPSALSMSMNMVEKLAIAPVPKLARPCEFGPTMRMPALCATSTMRRSLALPTMASTSPKPDAITTATLTPRAAQSSTAPMALSPATATITMSGASGKSARPL